MAQRPDDGWWVVERMLVALGVGSPEDARRIGDRALRRAQQEGQDKVLDRWAQLESPATVPAQPGVRPRTPRERERNRRRLFELTRPEMILRPVNVVAVYLREQPMWPAWDFAATEACNSRMLPLVQGLDPEDPLPDDSRLALPFTVAGLTLYRALQLGPLRRDPVGVLADVYHEIARGIALLDQLHSNATRQMLAGQLSREFLGDFTQTTMAAETFLLHPIRLGPEMWILVLQCPLGLRCRRGEPFYVSRPGAGKPHPACRTAKSRQGRATLKAIPGEKTTPR